MTKTRGRGRPRLYEWAELFKRGRFVLRKGLDFDCRVESMAQQIRNAAASRGQHVRIEARVDRVEVEVLDAA